MNLPNIHMPRLVIRQWHVDLAEEALAIYGDPEVMRFIREPFPDVAAQRSAIAEWIQRYAGLPSGLGSWPLFEKQTSRLVGTVLLKPLPGSARIEVGWHLTRAAWGNGYATEAGRAAIEYGFRDLGLKRIYAIVDPANERSLNVCRRIEMRYEGRTNEYYDRELELFSVRATPDSERVSEVLTEPRP